MSKTREEIAGEIVVALLGSLAPQGSHTIGPSADAAAKAYTTIYQAVKDAGLATATQTMKNMAS
ncbi:hypothetical protein ACIGEO_02915 [Stenotrophomonas bentonitica]|uniref:hypothetical protein n=1 Tax=Stenotrophomonas bentonitica TaxID=1450134 RepID=UPI0037D49376